MKKSGPAFSGGFSLLTLGFAWLLYYLFLPSLALDNIGLWLLVALFLSGMTALGSRPDQPSNLLLPALVAWVGFVVLSVASLPMLRASSYHSLLGVEQTKEFSQSLPPIDLDNAPLVSYNMAMRAAEKRLSDIPALGSQAQVGELQKQLINGRLYWVAFLEHRGFFAWMSQSTTPGYVRVSATDPSDVELVTEVKGKKLSLRYLTSAYFGDNAQRHLRFSGYATQGLTDYSAEVDEEGVPYLVASVFDRKVGGSGYDSRGVVVLDPQTGQQQFYPTASVPAWVDRVQPASMVQEQISDRLEYVNGWLNPSKKDQLAIAGELDLVYGADGQPYFYAGLTSVGRDGGLVGFMMVNTRTKEVTRYSLVGVTEPVAQNAAEGVMPEKKYVATNALPFLVDGSTPAYVMALQDGSGIARAYAVVDLRDYQRVAVADTLSAAVRQFQAKGSLDRTNVDPASAPDRRVIRGRVLRIGQEVRQGNTAYLFLLEGHPSKLFSADPNRADDLAVTRENDVVVISTLDNAQRVLPVLAFHNVTLGGDTASDPAEASKAKATAPAAPAQ